MTYSKSLSRKWSVSGQLLVALAGVVAVLVGIVIHHFQTKNWFIAKPLTSDQFQSDNFTIRTIPTTYYNVGELDKVLNGWYNPYRDPSHDLSMEGYIHLFRVSPDSPRPFTFDISKVTAKTQVESFLDPCDYPNSVICKVCLFTPDITKIDSKHDLVNVSEIMATPGNMYSSFARLDDLNSAKFILDSVRIPNLDLKKVNLEHAFIGKSLNMWFLIIYSIKMNRI